MRNKFGARAWRSFNLSMSLVALLGASAASADDAKKVKPPEGAFTCDFEIPGSYPPEKIGPLIERDRMYMAAQPGLVDKIIPIRFSEEGNIQSGGRYRFESRNDAAKYFKWMKEDFVLDGELFFDRDIFSKIDCHAWDLLHNLENGDLKNGQVVVRVERFSVPTANQKKALAEAWPAISAEAKKRNLLQVQVLYSDTENLVSLVYMGGRVGERNLYMPDFNSLNAVEKPTALGEPLLKRQGWKRIFDRTSWSLTQWRPFVKADRGEPALWTNSPPFPAPYCGDNVCEVSRGEKNSSCSADCTTTCGDAVCQATENTQNCPGDCRLESKPAAMAIDTP